MINKKSDNANYASKKASFFLKKSENYICNDKLCQKFMPLTQFLNNHLKKNLIRLITPAKWLLFFLESLKIIFTITNHAKKFVLLIQFLNNYPKKNLIRLITPAK